MDQQTSLPASGLDAATRGATRYDRAIDRVRALTKAGYTVPQAQFAAAREFNLECAHLAKEMGRRSAAHRKAVAARKAGAR